MRRCIQVFIAAIAMCTSCIVIVYKDTSEAPTVDAHRRLVVPSATTDTAGHLACNSRLYGAFESDVPNLQVFWNAWRGSTHFITELNMNMNVNME